MLCDHPCKRSLEESDSEMEVDGGASAGERRGVSVSWGHNVTLGRWKCCGLGGQGQPLGCRHWAPCQAPACPPKAVPWARCRSGGMAYVWPAVLVASTHH